MSERFADPELAAFLARSAPSLGPMDVVAIREGIAARAATRTPGPRLRSVRDLVVPGDATIPARLYQAGLGPAPMVVYLHGGGWSVGTLDSHDRLCRRLAVASGVAVLALDYRLAPEHRWPASVDDTVSALRWLAREESAAALGLAPTSVAVAGDSAGGTLAALACLRLRDEGPAALPSLQLLIYANTDLTGDHPSMREKATGWGLDADTVRFFNRQWVPDEALWSDPRVSPLHAADLSGLPPAVIVTAEHDPIRDEAEAYAGRLRQAGVDVLLRREDGLVHNFLLYDEISPACDAAAGRIADDLRTRLPAHP